MPAELKTMHRSASLGNFGELHVVGNGGAAVSTPNSGGRALLPILHLISTTHLKINGQNQLIPLHGDFC
jgi:hypothetical protein